MTATRRDADVFGYHYENESWREPVSHLRSGKIVDRRGPLLGTAGEVVGWNVEPKFVVAEPEGWKPIPRMDLT